MSSRRFNTRLFVVFALAMLLAVAAYGFAATNTVPLSYAGDGTGSTSGYTISNVHYVLGTTPNIDTVTFTLDHAASSVTIAAGGSSYSCSVAGGTSVSCDTTGTPLDAGVPFSSLRVTAAQ